MAQMTEDIIIEELFGSSLEQLEFDKMTEHVAGYAASAFGAEQIRALRPLLDVQTLRDEIRMVGEARELQRRDERIPLIGIYDIRRALALSKVGANWLAGEDLRAIYMTIQGMRLAREFFGTRSERAPLLHELTAPIHSNKLLEKHISDAIDENGEVRDSASRELFQIRRDIIAKSGALRERLGKILRRVAEDELLTEEYVTLREGRLVLPVRTEYKRRIPGIIHGESNTGSTVYLEPAEIFDMNNEIAELRFAERRECERILRVLTEEVGAEAEEFGESVWRIQHLDSVNARARYAEAYNCVEPRIVDEPTIRLNDARHPLLALRLDEVVPMSVDLDRENRAVIISGPNAGGKTIAMKTLGMITMMTQAGFHVPAGECVVSPGRLFSDIGDRQSVENDLSTFSAHMTRVHRIIDEIREGDIVLLDEIGTGTDPDEGAAIAAAILERILERGAFVVATTHHSALKVFAYNTAGVLNAGMEFNTENLTPTYRLIVGTPGNSYAFELLQRFGFGEELLQRARAFLGEERGALTDLIAQLEESLRESRRVETERQIALRSADEQKQRFEEENARLKEKRGEIIEAARAEARESLESVNSLIENTLREIREGASNDAIKEMRRRIEETRGSLKGGADASVELPAKSPDTLGLGDAVRLKDGMEIGEIESEPDEEGNVVVQFGGLRMRSNISELTKVSRSDKRKTERATRRDSVLNAEETKTRIDLRGMYPEEAISEIEKSITAALGSGVTFLEIIHGKGTGVLRQRTHEHLKHHPHIVSYRLGEVTEGGAGVTIVELA